MHYPCRYDELFDLRAWRLAHARHDQSRAVGLVDQRVDNERAAVTLDYVGIVSEAVACVFLGTELQPDTGGPVDPGYDIDLHGVGKIDVKGRDGDKANGRYTDLLVPDHWNGRPDYIMSVQVFPSKRRAIVLGYISFNEWEREKRPPRDGDGLRGCHLLQTVRLYDARELLGSRPRVDRGWPSVWSRNPIATDIVSAGKVHYAPQGVEWEAPVRVMGRAPFDLARVRALATT